MSAMNAAASCWRFLPSNFTMERPSASTAGRDRLGARITATQAASRHQRAQRDDDRQCDNEYRHIASAPRAPRETYSDVILRLAGSGEPSQGQTRS
jgi:hypothetical protein